MFRTLAILCVVGSACGAILGPWMPGLKIKHSSNMFAVGKDYLIDLPLSNKSASYEGYIRVNRPRLPAGYCPLQLWCRREDKFRVCIFTDETGDVAGVQFNIPCDEFEPKYDMGEQGFTIWTTTLGHRIVRFYAFFKFFVSPHSQKRIHSKDPTVVLRDNEVYFSGFHGKLASVATDQEKLNGIFTKQNCVNWLGHQYNFNMTKNQECSASTLSPFSAMYYSGHLVASRIIVTGHFIKKSKYKDGYEEINAIGAKNAAPNAPNCMYNGIADQGGISMTIYYINTPWKISCKPPKSHNTKRRH